VVGEPIFIATKGEKLFCHAHKPKSLLGGKGEEGLGFVGGSALSAKKRL